MTDPVSKMRAVSPKMTHKEGRDHLRFCATGTKLFVSVTPEELIKLCCELDAYEYYWDFFLRHFESIAAIIARSQRAGSPTVNVELINKILSEVNLYQQEKPTESPFPPAPNAPSAESLKKRTDGGKAKKRK